MESDSYLLFDPGPSRVGHDDGEVGEVGGHVVDARDGRAVLELEASASRHSEARGCEAGVDEHGHAEVHALPVEGVETLVVGLEGLVYGVELQPPQSELGHGPLQLLDCGFHLPGVHRGKSDEPAGVVFDDASHVVVGIGWLAGGGLGIH